MKYPRLVVALPLVGLGLLASGCERGYGRRPALSQVLFSTAEERIARYHEQVDRESAEREFSDGPSYRPIFVVTRAALPLAPAELPSVPPPPPFDAARARDILAGVDLSQCRQQEATRGYGHARVTFNPAGDISKVVIDEPTGMSLVAAKCVGEALGQATVPVFTGSLVTVGTTWFVP